MTKPMAGQPFHGGPTVTKVVFETNGAPNAEPPAKYAADLLTRTVGHLNTVGVEDLTERLLLDRQDFRDLDYHELAMERFWTTRLVETVIDEIRAGLRTRLAIDLATTLIPRLKGTRS